MAGPSRGTGRRRAALVPRIHDKRTGELERRALLEQVRELDQNFIRSLNALFKKLPTTRPSGATPTGDPSTPSDR